MAHSAAGVRLHIRGPAMDFTFGSDPEFMLGRMGKLQSAIGVLPPKERAVSKDGSSFYHDNVLAEIAVKPGSSKDEVLSNTEAAIRHLAKLVAPCSVMPVASAKYPQSQLTDKAARTAGCKPEWDVYSLRCNMPPEKAMETGTHRTAGGHIHIGADGLDNPIAAFDVIRMMDLFIGVPSVFMDKDETSKDRRKLYGHAGSHRATDYGFEYRSLGNFWLSSPELVYLVYDLTAFVLEFVADGQQKRFWSLNEMLLDGDDPSKAYSCTGYDIKLLQKAINSCDKKIAEKFMIFISNFLPDGLYDRIDQVANSTASDIYECWGISASV